MLAGGFPPQEDHCRGEAGCVLLARRPCPNSSAKKKRRLTPSDCRTLAVFRVLLRLVLPDSLLILSFDDVRARSVNVKVL